MSEVADVIDALGSFETQNSVRITMEIGLTVATRGPALAITVNAWRMGGESAERALLDSVAVNTSALNLKTLSAALLHALYAMDFKLAVKEWENVEVKKA